MKKNDRVLVKDLLLPQTVVPAVCNMGERVLPTVQVLSEIGKTQAKRGGRRAEKLLETRTVKPKNIIRESERGVCGAAHGEC